MVLYCTECGKKHEYTLSKPRFCEGCGNSFQKGEQQNIPQKTQEKAAAVSRKPISGDDEDADIVVPEISKIQVEIDINTNKGISFKDIKSSNTSFKRDPRNKLSTKEVLENYDKFFEKDREDSESNEK